MAQVPKHYVTAVFIRLRDLNQLATEGGLPSLSDHPCPRSETNSGARHNELDKLITAVSADDDPRDANIQKLAVFIGRSRSRKIVTVSESLRLHAPLVSDANAECVTGWFWRHLRI